MKSPSVRWFGALALLVSACSSTPPAKEPDPSLEEKPAQGDPDPNAVAAASSAKVQQGIDAIQKEDFAGAKAVLSEARKEAPNDAQAAYYLGVALQSLGEPAARAEYEAALKLDPKLTEASVNLSQIQLEAGDADQALGTIDAALKTAPKHPDLLLNRAIALEAAGKKEEALKAYGDASAAKPDDVELRIAYADLLRQNGKGEEAVAELRKALSSEDPTLLAAAARQFGLNKAFSDCVAALDKAIKLKSSADLLVRRGVCRHEVKDDAGAQADYQAALAVDGNFAPAHYYMGMHLRTKDKKKALEHLDKAATLAKAEGVGPAAKREADELRKKK